MGATLPTLSEQSAPERTISVGGQDRLLDVVRSAAIARVVLWHTWSWFWLTWIPAMPAMFFTTGALLDKSLARRGWTQTVRQRLRRLMIPYWLYASASWVLMLAQGWRPTMYQGLTWLIPLGDPVGSAAFPGLWVPLWYVRAYLWFVLGSGLLGFALRRIGSIAIHLSATATICLWWMSHTGHEVPMAVGDAVAYLPFVLAGMQYSRIGRRPRPAVLVALAVSAGLSAIWVVREFGPPDMVVNRSYLLTLLVGVAGISAMVALRTRLVTGTAGPSRLASAIDTVNSHALTIYLWQGFGLVAAQHLVELRVANPVAKAVLSLAVVTAVIAGAVTLFGWVEDWAARRRPKLPRPSSLALSAAPLAVLLVAVTLPLPSGALVDAPLSGRAVVARAGLVDESLRSGTEPPDAPETERLTPNEVLERWAAQNSDLIKRIGMTKVEAAIRAPDGEFLSATWPEEVESNDEDLAWWSMTKSVTTTWMMRLVEAGSVSLDDHLSKWVPEAPHAGEMTLEQLARHTSGIPTSLDKSFFEATPSSEIEAYYQNPELAFPPGDGFNYSRIGYYLLALALERAASTSWVEAVRQMGDAAGVTVRFDDELSSHDHVTDPDRHGYRGGLWAAGGLVTDLSDATKLLQWIFTKGLTPGSVEAMTRFSSDPGHWYYGLGLMPSCPCEKLDGHLRAARFGLDSGTGLFSVDAANRATVMLRPDVWWEGKQPVTEFYELQNSLLDSVGN